MHVYFTKIKERATAVPGNSLHSFCCKGQLCSRWSHYLPCMKGYKLPTALFGKSLLKSIPRKAVYYEIDTRKCTKLFYGKYNGIYITQYFTRS